MKKRSRLKKIKKILKKKFLKKKSNQFQKPTFIQKLTALFVQILMLPISCLIQILNGSTLIILIGVIYTIASDGYDGEVALLMIGMIVPVLLDYGLGFLIAIPYAKKMSKIKSSYFEGGTWGTGIGTVEYDIKDSYGSKIGTYETQGTVYDYDESKDQILARVRAALALPLRIISVLVAIVGLFTDKFYVRISSMAGISYNHTLHLWLDMIVPYSPRNK